MPRVQNVAQKLTFVALALAVAGCSTTTPIASEETRAHDSRVFTPPAIGSTFAAMAALPTDAVAVASSSRWSGVLKGSAYMVEVPANWNGKLVMFAHGYAGIGPALSVAPPAIRRHLIQTGYAWAASSYSTNYYDVRAGVEDTNALALAFNSIAAQNGRPLAAPVRTYITGRSMGGHIAAAAVERESMATAVNKVQYHASLPMCGVMADTELFNVFAGMQVAALSLAGIPSYPFAKWAEVEKLVSSSLFTSFPTAASPTLPISTTAKGAQFASVVKNLTGGERPMFAQGFEYGGSYRFAYGGFGGDGTINGILAKNTLDTQALRYMIDGDAAATSALNASAQKLTAQPDANRLRKDGLRWIPAVNGEFKVPVCAVDSYAGRPVCAVRHAAELRQTRSGSWQQPVGATRPARCGALRLHGGRASRVLRSFGQVGARRRQTPGRRRLNRRHRGRPELRLHVYQQHDGAG